MWFSYSIVSDIDKAVKAKARKDRTVSQKANQLNSQCKMWPQSPPPSALCRLPFKVLDFSKKLFLNKLSFGEISLNS